MQTPCQISINFMQFSAKDLPNNRLELVPRLGNPGSTTVLDVNICQFTKNSSVEVKSQDKHRVLGLNFPFNYHHQVP